MTVQEKAIEQLERVNKHLATIGEKEDYTGAIQALEQCEDAVSRQAVLDIVKFEENWLSDAKSNNADTDIAFSGIRTQVAKLSPVTKALEPCEDCISRKAVLDKAWDVPYEGKYVQVVDVGDIKELPPVTPKKDGWTPCGKQLPKPKETENLIAKYYLVQNEYGDMMVARWDGKGWEQMYQHEYLEDDVIAWMPLPEKYKAETEGDK